MAFKLAATGQVKCKRIIPLRGAISNPVGISNSLRTRNFFQLFQGYMSSFTVVVYSAVTPTAIDQTCVFLFRDHQDKMPSLFGGYGDPFRDPVALRNLKLKLGSGSQAGRSSKM